MRYRPRTGRKWSYSVTDDRRSLARLEQLGAGGAPNRRPRSQATPARLTRRLSDAMFALIEAEDASPHK